ncbi:hypothetical protein SDJN02_09306, partial [Cucurbita argyrosperma subsp. argyrosperma]
MFQQFALCQRRKRLQEKSSKKHGDMNIMATGVHFAIVLALMLPFNHFLYNIASISALRANHGCAPDPMEATIPVLAMGQVKLIPRESSSVRMNSLVSNSWNESSGFSCSFLRDLTNQSKNSGVLADSKSSEVR